MTIPAYARVDQHTGRPLTAAQLAVRAQHYGTWQSQAKRVLSARNHHHMRSGLALSRAAAAGRRLDSPTMRAHAREYRRGEQVFQAAWAEIKRRSGGRMQAAIDDAERREQARYRDRPSSGALHLVAIRSLADEGRRGNGGATRMARRLAIRTQVDQMITESIGDAVYRGMRRALHNLTRERHTR